MVSKLCMLVNLWIMSESISHTGTNGIKARQARIVLSWYEKLRKPVIFCLRICFNLWLFYTLTDQVQDSSYLW